MKLKELLHSLNEEDTLGFVNIDDWRWPDVDHLVTMGFEFLDDYRVFLPNPHIIVYQKREGNDNFFYIEEPNKPTKRCASFNDVVNYFDNYPQPEYDKNVQ